VMVPGLWSVCTGVGFGGPLVVMLFRKGGGGVGSGGGREMA